MSVLSVWQLIGSQAAFCSATVFPASGTLGPNEEKEFCIELSANIMVSLKTDAIFVKTATLAFSSHLHLAKGGIVIYKT